MKVRFEPDRRKPDNSIVGFNRAPVEGWPIRSRRHESVLAELRIPPAARFDRYTRTIRPPHKTRASAEDASACSNHSARTVRSRLL